MSWVWTVWLFALVPGSFAALEAYAIWKKKTTLSRYVWNITKAFPPFGWIAGALTGFLVSHFWWGGVVCFSGG